MLLLVGLRSLLLVLVSTVTFLVLIFAVTLLEITQELVSLYDPSKIVNQFGVSFFSFFGILTHLFRSGGRMIRPMLFDTMTI